MMYKISLMLMFIICSCLTTFAQSRFDQPSNNSYSQKNGIEDGWYKASVEYTNFSTNTFENYSLKVKVENNKVVRIDFGNGGYIHNSYNSEGYIWSGGSLSFETNYQGSIISAKSNITISDLNGMRSFKVTIQ